MNREAAATRHEHEETTPCRETPLPAGAAAVAGRSGNSARPPRFMSVEQQRSLAGRYPLWVKGVALAAFTWAFLGWLNDAWFYKFDNSILLNRYTEYLIILGFGAWRVRAEKNPYTRQRLTILLANVAVLWWLIPWLFPFIEPYVGYLGAQPAFPSLHTPGTLTFFLVLGAVTLFGRRVICGWNCPCVAIREVVGFPFRHRDHVPRGRWAWRLRHLKWFWFALYLGAMVAMIRPANNVTSGYLGFFALIVILPYFVTMLLSPWIGNRGYCRFICPYGATFGLLNKVGAFHIAYTAEECTRCGLCEKVCDMGIPVWKIGALEGKISTTECMGCGRCVTECPTHALALHDIRDLLATGRRQERRELLRRANWGLTTTRWRVAGVTLALLTLLAGSGLLASRVGSTDEWSHNLGEVIPWSGSSR